MSLISKFLLGGTLLASLSAQGVNCRLLANRNPLTGATASRNNYAGMWGAVINGREYAILPARSGTYIYDCSTPSNPVQLALVPGSAPTNGIYWREASSLGNYAYIASEHAVLQIIDLAANPPALVTTFGGRAHSLQCDATNNRLWANGGAVSGAVIYSLANPTAPTQLASFTTSYVHDCYPRDNYCYLAHINAGNFRIVDTRNLPTISTLSTVTTPGAFTHNTWINKNATLMVTTDENQGGCLAFYDITLKNLPVQLATWCSPAGATVHNAFIRGKVVHLSSYTAGYYAVDISEPATPRLICSYDTNARTGSGYTGCWGAYPLSPSGTVYLADMEFGLFVVEPTCGVPVEYGTGTAGTGNVTPTVDYGGGFAQVGRTTFKLECTDMLPNAPVALFVGTASANTPVFGINLNVDLAQPFVQVLGGANAQGRMDVTIPIPSAANLAGGTLYAQAITADPAGPQGLAASRGFRVTICP